MPTKINSGSEKQTQNSTAFLPLPPGSSLSHIPMPCKLTWRMAGGLQPLRNGASLPSSSSHLSPALMWTLHGLQFSSGISLCFTLASSVSCGGYLLFHGDVPPPLSSDFGVPFLKHVFPEVSPACLRDSAVLCSMSVGSGCVPHGTASGFFPQQPLLCQPVATETWNTEFSKILRTYFVSWVMRFCPLLLLSNTM